MIISETVDNPDWWETYRYYIFDITCLEHIEIFYTIAKKYIPELINYDSDDLLAIYERRGTNSYIGITEYGEIVNTTRSIFNEYRNFDSSNTYCWRFDCSPADLTQVLKSPFKVINNRIYLPPGNWELDGNVLCLSRNAKPD